VPKNHGTDYPIERMTMKIDDDHMYHGAALIQIAEHPQFTAINSFKGKLAAYENAYRINSDIAVYLKYAAKPNKSHQEYVFTFSMANLDELAALVKVNGKTYLALVCVQAREVCSLPYDRLQKLIVRRQKAVGKVEDQYTLLVTARKNEGLHVYVNAPNKKNTKLGNDIVVSRKAFPGDLFE
jgi:hypothetical protein